MQKKFNGKGDTFQQIVLEQMHIQMQRESENLDIDLIPYTHTHTHTHTNSEWVINLNVKYKALQLLEENIAENLHDIRFGDEILDITTKVSSTKEKNRLN